MTASGRDDLDQLHQVADDAYGLFEVQALYVAAAADRVLLDPSTDPEFRAAVEKWRRKRSEWRATADAATAVYRLRHPGSTDVSVRTQVNDELFGRYAGTAI